MGKPVNKTLRIAAMSAGEEIGHVSGSIVTFRGNGAPLRSLLVNIDPVQDLHGYDNPWPAGGGKNLLPYATIESPLTKQGITFVRNQDGSIAVNGTSTASFAQTLVEFALEPGNYYFNCGNGFSFQPNTYIYIRDVDNSRTLADINSSSIGVDKPFSIDVQTNVRFYMVFGATGLASSGTLYPMIRLASETDATFAPYSNICPISGWSAVNVWVKPTYDPMANPTVTIQLGDTYYGGTLDVTNGVLTVEYAILSKKWSEGTNSGTATDIQRKAYFPPVNADVSIKSKFKCNYAKVVSSYSVVGLLIVAANQFYLTLPTDTDGDTNIQILYPLATPITIPLTPQEISTLQGQNNVWADSGNVDVEYIATGGEGGKLALLLRNRKELLIALRKGLSPAEAGLLGSIPSLGGSLSPGVIRPGLNTQEEEEDEKDDA